MTSWASPVDSNGGMWSGGGATKAWWDFPAPLGPPKLQNTPGTCWHEQVAKTGERFWMPVMCNGNISYPPGHVFPEGVPWQTWFGGP